MSRGRELGFWTGQWVHGIALAALLPAAYLAWHGLGRPQPFWFWLAIAVPVVHQLFVWVTWRLELAAGATSRVIGFRGYLVGFRLLLLGRPLALAALAIADRGTLGMPGPLRGAVAMTLAVPALYTGYSLARYLGLERSAGGDHFDERYRAMPLVREGAFRFTRNAMYTLGFLGFWALAIGADSSASLVATAFAHAHVWVHYFATEQPDLEELHEARAQESR